MVIQRAVKFAEKSIKAKLLLRWRHGGAGIPEECFRCNIEYVSVVSENESMDVICVVDGRDRIHLRPSRNKGEISVFGGPNGNISIPICLQPSSIKEKQRLISDRVFGWEFGGVDLLTEYGKRFPVEKMRVVMHSGIVTPKVRMIITSTGDPNPAWPFMDDSFMSVNLIGPDDMDIPIKVIPVHESSLVPDMMGPSLMLDGTVIEEDENAQCESPKPLSFLDPNGWEW